jgi:hypothetical protein
MEGPFGFLQIVAMLFGTINDGGQGDLLMVGCTQAIFDIAVIVTGEGNFLVLDNVFFD